MSSAPDNIERNSFEPPDPGRGFFSQSAHEMGTTVSSFSNAADGVVGVAKDVVGLPFDLKELGASTYDLLGPTVANSLPLGTGGILRAAKQLEAKYPGRPDILKMKTDAQRGGAKIFMVAGFAWGLARAGIKISARAIQKSLPVPKSLPKSIHSGGQGKHVKGHKNFIQGRSALSDGVDPQKLLDGIHDGTFPVVGTGSRGTPIVDFGKEIGIDANSGLSTQFGNVHFGKNGAHIVPHNPNRINR